MLRALTAFLLPALGATDPFAKTNVPTAVVAPSPSTKVVGTRAVTSPGQWTWAGGPDRVAEFERVGSYGTKGVAAPGNVPGSRYGAATWRDAAGNLWLFGGDGYASDVQWGRLNDLWKWDGANWTWVSGRNAVNDPGSYGTKGVAAPTNLPPPRSDAVAWVDGTGTFWLFGGGPVGDPTVAYSDLWKWDGTNWTWVGGSDTYGGMGIYGTKGVGAPENWPGARTGAASWKDADGNVWLFGGDGRSYNPEIWFSDLWKWDGSVWTWMAGPNVSNQPGTYGDLGTASPTNVPGARFGATAWRGADGAVRLFGGEGYSATEAGLLNDLWLWDGTNWAWIGGSATANPAGDWGTKGVAAASNVPSGRREVVSWKDATGSLWLLGGWGKPLAGPDGALNDLWKLDGATWTWVGGSSTAEQPGTYGTKGVPGPENESGARYRGAAWSAPSGEVWIFGGWGASATGTIGLLNDLWHFDGTWTWWSGTDGASLAGVYGTKGVPSPGNHPGARWGSVTWRTANGDFWLFGGNGYSARGQGGLNDLWRWDGAAWTWMGGSDAEDQPGDYGTKGVPAPGNMPGSRYGAVASADLAGNLWLFGGWRFTTPGGSLNDLWRWDGTTWTWISGSSAANDLGNWGTLGVPDPANVPRSRRQAMAWTDAAGHFWILGGYGWADRRDQDDLWRWDGTNWTWMSGGLPPWWPSGGIPSGRRNGATWVDQSDGLWLYGGYRQTSPEGPLGDLWRWNGTSWSYMGHWPWEPNGVYGTLGVAAPANHPGVRSGATAWTDSRGNAWLFGGSGQTPGGSGGLNDLWRWDGTNWTWMRGAATPSPSGVYGSLGTPAPGNDPGGRTLGASWAGSSGTFWLLGGWGTDSAGVSGNLRDLWVYEPPACTPPPGVLVAPGSVLDGSSGNEASVSDADPGATYEWTISGGTLDSGQGTSFVLFSPLLGAKSIALGVVVRKDDCATSGEKTILVGTYHVLEVVRNGVGNDRVEASPGGVNCSATCSVLQAHGTTVHLTAYPSGTSRFGGWTGGGCSGMGECLVTMDGPKTVSATFFPWRTTRFYGVTPCRVVDTRNPDGPLAGPALAAAATRAFTVGGVCGIPADATAVALNVTVTGATAPGSLTLYPGTGPAPDASSVNFAEKTRANNVTMGLVGGVLSILDRQESGQVDLILDVSGYYR